MRFLKLFLLLTLMSVSTMAQEDGTKVKVYNGGKVISELSVDSIVVEESMGPQVAGKTVAFIVRTRNEEGVYSSHLLVNGKEQVLTVPDDDGNYTYCGLAEQGGNLYVLAVKRIMLNDAYFNDNSVFAVWKNGKFLYTVTSPKVITATEYGIKVDNEDIYVYGSCLSSAKSEKIDRGFYYKNQDAPVLIAGGEDGLRGFDVQDGKVYSVYSYRGYTSYHSASSAWTNIAQVWYINDNGNQYAAQRLDRSCLYYPNDLTYHNGKVHVVGYVDRFGNADDRYFIGQYYDGSSCKDLDTGITRSYAGKIAFDGQDNCYILCKTVETPDEDTYIHSYTLLKNGTPHLQLTLDNTVSLYERNNFICFDGEDIYTTGHYYDSDEGTSVYLVWKNDQLVWQLNGYINGFLIY